jgi:DNA-directed RNA polymerase specialized sigma24 family protein
MKQGFSPNREPSAPLAVKSKLPPEPATLSATWRDLIAKVKSGEPAGFEQLHIAFASGLRYLLMRRLGDVDLEILIADIERTVVSVIQASDDFNPEELPSLLRSTMQCKVTAYIASHPPGISHDSTMPWEHREQDLETQRRVKEMMPNVTAALMHLSDRDRQFLSRLYLRGQSPRQIQTEMQLNDAQLQVCELAKKHFAAEIAATNVPSPASKHRAVSGAS